MALRITVSDEDVKLLEMDTPDPKEFIENAIRVKIASIRADLAGFNDVAIDAAMDGLNGRDFSTVLDYGINKGIWKTAKQRNEAHEKEQAEIAAAEAARMEELNKLTPEPAPEPAPVTE